MNSGLWRDIPVSVKFLIVMSFLMNMGFYALIPYLSLHLTGSFGWTLAMAGLLLALRQFCQQGIAFLGGMVSDAFGYKQTLALGTFVRAAGFGMFAFCTETWHFIVAAILSGLGGAFFEPAGAAAFAVLTPEEIRKEVYALRNVLSNIGVVGSQVIGAVLSMVDFFWLSVFTSLLYIICSALALVFLPNMNTKTSRGGFAESVGIIFKDRPFLCFTGILVGYYYIYMQLFLAIPQFVEDTMHSKSAVGIVVSCISLAIILFQMKVMKWLEGFQQRFTLIGAGTVLMGFGLFLLSFAHGLWMILLDVTIFAFGVMISIPYLVDMVPRFAPKEYLGAYYGFNGYSLAIGGSVGTVAGGWMYDLGQHMAAEWLPWAVCLVVGMFAAWGLYRMENAVTMKIGKQV